MAPVSGLMCDGRDVDGLSQSDIDVEAPTAVLYLENLLGKGSKVKVSRNTVRDTRNFTKSTWAPRG